MEQLATLETITPAAYNETLAHVDTLNDKPWRANIATRVHNDALRFARETAKTIDVDPEALIDWLCLFADMVYAKHLQTLNQWDEAAVGAVAQSLLADDSHRDLHVAWLEAFLNTVQADSSMTKKRMASLIQAVHTTADSLPAVAEAAEPVVAADAPQATTSTLVGRRLSGKRARKLLANFKH